MTGSFVVCILSFLVLVFVVRRSRFSLGLPVAYLFGVLLQHLPGGMAHIVSSEFFSDSEPTEIGLRITAWGSFCFVVGVIIAQGLLYKKVITPDPTAKSVELRGRFIRFCLICGWFIVYAINPFIRIPSISAALDQGSSIWILGILLGLLASVAEKGFLRSFLWFAALAVYPFSILIQVGFLSFGSTSVFIVLAALMVKTKGAIRSYLGIVLFSMFAFLTFVSYFQVREELRKAVWGGATFDERFDQTKRIVTEFGWFDPTNPQHLSGLDIRLNQNKFIGMAAINLDSERVEYLRGRSVVEAFQALIPRAVWPNKPVFAGSSRLIQEVSLKEVNDRTKFGVGLIMEFYVNWGMPSLIFGSIFFGFMFGWVDKASALKLDQQDYEGVLPWFLVATAMNAPLGLISKMAGDVISALVAGFGWRFLWRVYSTRNQPTRFRPAEPTVDQDAPSLRSAPNR